MALLEVENLGVAFGGVRALSSLNMSVPEGKIVGLIGPNGAGKTTFFNVVTRLTDPDAGDVKFKGKSILKWAAHDVARHGICRTFQTPQVFRRLTVLENCLVGAHAQMRTGLLGGIIHVGKAFGEERKFNDHAEMLMSILGLQAVKHDRVDSLNLISQRRVELARALMSNPSLLLLDEATAGMTWEEKEMMVESIGLMRDVHHFTTLVVEHDMRLIHAICDHIVVLNFGQRIAAGPPERIKSDPAVIQAYMGEEEEDGQ